MNFSPGHRNSSKRISCDCFELRAKFCSIILLTILFVLFVDGRNLNAQSSSNSAIRNERAQDDVQRTTWNVQSPIPDEIVEQFTLKPFYRKCVVYKGFPIVSSDKVADQALLEAAYQIDKLLFNREDIVDALIEGKVRFAVMATDEFTTDIPEHSHLTPKKYWDKRARGLGATPSAPCVSCGEENLLHLPGDTYFTENILIHEFAHAIHEVGMRGVDPAFDERLKSAYDTAMKAEKWKGLYAATNHREYFAEGVQSWFHCNRTNDAQHNHVNSRDQLREYDPNLAELVEYVFPDNDKWEFKFCDQRETDLEHMEGFDRESKSDFEWPKHLAEFDAYQWEQDQRKNRKKNEK